MPCGRGWSNKSLRFDVAARHAWRARVYENPIGILGICHASPRSGGTQTHFFSAAGYILFPRERNVVRLDDRRDDLLHDRRIIADDELTCLLDTDSSLDHDDDKCDGDVSGISAQRRSSGDVFDRAADGTAAGLLATPLNLQHAAIGDTVQHRQFGHVLHYGRLDSDDQFDALFGADFGLEEHHDQCDHGSLRLPDKRCIQRHLFDPGAGSEFLCTVRHILHGADCNSFGHKQQRDDLLHYQWGHANDLIHSVPESVPAHGFDHNYS